MFSGIKGGKVVSSKVIGTWAQEGVGVFVYRPKYRHVCVCVGATQFLPIKQKRPPAVNVNVRDALFDQLAPTHAGPYTLGRVCPPHFHYYE